MAPKWEVSGARRLAASMHMWMLQAPRPTPACLQASRPQVLASQPTATGPSAACHRRHQLGASLASSSSLCMMGLLGLSLHTQQHHTATLVNVTPVRRFLVGVGHAPHGEW